jgi:hypothetical protein
MLVKCGFTIEATDHYWDDDLMYVLSRKRPKQKKIEWQKDEGSGRVL